jgi:long chain fatty acid CoA FadD26
MPVIDLSIPAALHELAIQRADEPAYTFVDYEIDASGYSESLTWSEVLRRVEAVAAEIAPCGSPGDRVAIVAPQTLDYVLGFLAALAAGFVAVPLSAPMFGIHDERVAAALNDCSPVAILTTTAAIDDVVACARELPGFVSPVIELDALNILGRQPLSPRTISHTETALLQYTSGSTRRPAGVVISHENVIANLEQVVADYFEDTGNVPQDVTLVSWLPFYHDMGMLLGITAPALLGRHAVLTTPMAFLQKPARWMQQLARNTKVFSAAPNFAFELAARRTSDADMGGLDLGNVHSIISGSERVQAATVRRFADRFARFNLPANAVAPSYGLAEAMVYVASAAPGRRPTIVRFDPEKLSAGHAKRCESEAGSELVSVGAPRACTVRVVDPETRMEKPAGEIGEIWVHGDNVASGYWRNPQLSQRVFGGRLVAPSPGTPEMDWLRTGDLGVLSEGELFIIGRIKDLLIVDGQNHYPDDIEATVQEITGGRVVAISIPDGRTERLVMIVEVKKPGTSDEEALRRLHRVKREVTSAISNSHSLRVADFVMVPPARSLSRRAARFVAPRAWSVICVMISPAWTPHDGFWTRPTSVGRRPLRDSRP